MRRMQQRSGAARPAYQESKLHGVCNNVLTVGKGAVAVKNQKRWGRSHSSAIVQVQFNAPASQLIALVMLHINYPA